MLSLDSALRPRAEDLVAKVLDGEALIINMATGVYYSTATSGAFIWEHIAGGCRLRDIAAALAARYGIPLARAEADVLELAAKLLEEKLVTPCEGAPATTAIDVSAIPLSAYESPELEIYRDIGHLVALDPPMPGLKDLPWKGPSDDTSS